MGATLVRLAHEGDHDAVRELYRELRPRDPVMGDAASLSIFCAVLRSSSARLVVALTHGEVGATCMLALLPNFANGGMPIGVIEHVVTAGRVRGRGLARAALEFALDTAWSLNCCKVLLLSGVQRADAHRLYASVGFVGGTELGFVKKNPCLGNHD